MKVNSIVTFIGILVAFSCQEKKGKIYVVDCYPDGKDAIISLPNANMNHGSEPELNIYCDTVNGIKHTNRAVIFFDLEEIPKDVEIDSVFLQLYFNDSSGLYKIKPKGHKGETGLIAESVMEEWEENTVTWKMYPKIGQKRLFFESHRTSDQDLRIDVTQLCVTQEKKFGVFYGFLLRLQNETVGNYLHLYSKESRKKGKAPKLKIYGKK